MHVSCLMSVQCLKVYNWPVSVSPDLAAQLSLSNVFHAGRGVQLLARFPWTIFFELYPVFMAQGSASQNQVLSEIIKE